ncbi:uncharacterized protein troap isoform X2 [Paramisgurnus dabryanus]|uniref:uncharacterized protein troap isoform X2 n=1 Tax=Paramisgurnus dabryanus TaxID=90735 RepID=UPI0031F3F2CD
MASSNHLRPQNRTLQNQTGMLKHQVVNKTKQTAVSTSRRGSENLDPNAEADAGKGVSKLKGVSRLPVLAKSLQPAVNYLSQQNKWEQRPLTGKAQKKKIYTKPVPFNFTQSRTRSQRSTEVGGGKTPLTPGRLTPGAQLRSHNAAATLGVLKTSHKTQSVSIDGHPPKAETLSNETRNGSDLSSRLGNITLVQSKHSEDSGLSHLCKTSLSKVGVCSDGQAQKDKTSIQQSSHAGTKAMHNVPSCEGSSAVGAQGVMPRLSTCPPGSSNNLAQRVSVKKTQREIVSGTGNTGAFSPDPSALRSILQNDATRIVESVGATPRISTCPAGRQTSFYSAQRVPVKKPHTDDSTAKVTGSTVSFSPDPSALHSILQNEGIRVGTLGGATPRVSTCPTGRGTSIYSAQRVPVKKTKTEATGTASHCQNRTPGRTWTPQRVPNTKPQSMRRLLTAQKMSQFRDSPGLNGPQDPSTELIMQQVEDVVQRLFEDPDQTDNDQTNKSDVSSQQLLTTSTSHQTIEPVSNKENSDVNHHHTADDGKKAAQPFIQSAHRSSVIVFSSTQRLCGSDRPLQTPVTEAPLHLCVDSVISHNALQSDQNGHSDATKHINNCTQRQIKVSALRRRHTPLEEMILDEECATYTSRPLSCPLQPRSDNPVATILLFQDSTCFLPIGLSSPIGLRTVPGSSIRT